MRSRLSFAPVAASAVAIAVAASGCGRRPAARTALADPAIAAPSKGAIAEPDPSPGKPVIQRSLAAIGLDPDAIDRTADPCDDFYQFACGGWINTTEIPADKSIAMRSFVAIEDRNFEYEHAMLEQARTQPGTDPAQRQLGAFYGSCMDQSGIEAAGLSALRPALAAIDQIASLRGLAEQIGALHASGIAVLFDLSPVQDAMDARRVIARIDQGGLGLPDRELYLRDDEASFAARTAYRGYAEAVLAMLGHRAAAQEAGEILALETELARLSKDRAARRDPRANDHRIDRAGVARAMPRFEWAAFWTAVGLGRVREVTVTSPEFLAGVDQLLGSTRLSTWRAYLGFHLVGRSAPLLPGRIEEAAFQLESLLTGQPELPPRWKRCVQRTEEALGDLVGEAFVRDRFGETGRAGAEAQIRAIVRAMAAEIDQLAWMDPDTKARARAKLDAMTYRVGFPIRWRRYPFKLDPKAFTANALAARRAERARQLAKIGRPVDKDDWQMIASEVNAYYDAQLNGMVFPAGILQPPLYSIDASIPVNLGGIGVVVGHELTHGFDDQGAQYDALGNLANWWRADTAQQFKQRTQCVIDQYNRYEVAGSTKLSGETTVGENIADIGGVALSLAAYRALRTAARDRVIASGFTEDQQFFLGFGQAWCAKMRPDFEKLLAAIDVHAPAKWRVNGALSATPAFAQAFRCRAGRSMAPAVRCQVW
jgi:putative endopeptidase